MLSSRVRSVNLVFAALARPSNAGDVIVRRILHRDDDTILAELVDPTGVLELPARLDCDV